MPHTQPLTCLFLPDLFPWERCAFLPLCDSLSQRHSVRILEFDSGSDFRLQLSKFSSKESLWVVSQNHTDALEKILPAFEGTVFVSVLSVPEKPLRLSSLWEHIKNRPARSAVRWLAHTPFAARFLSEVVGVSPQHVHLVNLPVSTRLGELVHRSVSTPCVAIIGEWTRKNNLHFILSVAHYVRQNNVPCRFKFYGTGHLESHFRQVTSDLGLEGMVDWVPMGSVLPKIEADLFLHFPIRDELGIGPTLAAASATTLICADAAGLETLPIDGMGGFVLSDLLVRPLGELVLRLLENQELRDFMGNKLRKVWMEHSHISQLSGHYSKIFFSNHTENTAWVA